MEMSRKGVVVVVGCSQGGIIVKVKAQSIFPFLTADPAAAAAAAHTRSRSPATKKESKNERGTFAFIK